MTLTSDLEHLQCIAWDMIKLCTKSDHYWAIRGVIAISVIDLKTLNKCVTCCARFWDNFNQVWPSISYPCLNHSVFFILIRYATAWPWPLTRWPWKFVGHQTSCGQRLYEIWAKSSNPGWIVDNFANFCTGYVTLWPWPLTPWSWTFIALRMSCM